MRRVLELRTRPKFDNLFHVPNNQRITTNDNACRFFIFMKDAEYKGLMVDISVVDGAKQHAVLEFLPKIPSVGDMIDSRRLGIVEVSTVILRTAAVNSVIGSGVPRPEVDVVIVCRPVSSKQISRRRIPVNALYSPQERLSQLA